MAIQYPISLSDFQKSLSVRSITFDPIEDITQSGTERGEVQSASRGDTLWGGTVVAALSKNQDPSAAKLDIVKQVGATFFVSDTKRRYPQAHPGEVLSAQIGAVDQTDRRVLTLTGLSNGVVLTAGDHISFAYGVSPERHYLGRLVEGGVVSAGAVEISVLPFLPLGLLAGPDVALYEPSCLAKYVPNSYQPIERLPGYDSGFSFKWRQTKR